MDCPLTGTVRLTPFKEEDFSIKTHSWTGLDQLVGRYYKNIGGQPL